MKKKILSMVFVLSMLCVFVPVTAMAETGIEYGDYLYYKVNGNNTAVIITDCNTSVTEIAIPNEIDGLPVKVISDYAFQNCDIASITIPDSVTSIGNYAFIGCSSLTSITISDSVTFIGDFAFMGCDITSVYISDLAAYLNIDFSGLYSNPMEYESKLYLNNKRLAGEVTIPNGVTQIPDYAFSGCDGITSVTISDSVTSIGYRAFNNCSSITSVTISDSVTSIGYWAFNNCSSITSVIIPDSVTSIGDYAFYGCNILTSVIIPDRVKSIGNGAFQHCGLTSVTIPDSVTSIGDGAFYDCGDLTAITITDNVTSIGNDMFSRCSSLTSVTLPNSVESIGDGAFRYCYGLKRIVIPKSVTEIEQYAFDNCSNLTTVEYGGSQAEWNEIYIGANNDYLKNAKINYNSSLVPTPKPIPTPKSTPIPTTTATVIKTDTDMAYNFDVAAAEKYENCHVYAAVYDESGVLLAVRRVPLEMTGSTTISVNKSANDALAKVFIFAENMQPIITAEKFPLT